MAATDKSVIFVIMFTKCRNCYHQQSNCLFWENNVLGAFWENVWEYKEGSVGIDA